MMIPFNQPPYFGSEDKYVLEAIRSGKLSGDGYFTKKCQDWFEKHTGCDKALLTPNCTQALEMAAILIDTKHGDEIIMPSYTFVSTANAFALRGAKIVFVDIRPDTMNINENLIEQAITAKTKAIVPVHYAGVACEMDTIMDIAKRHKLYVIEDAAQGMMATYKGKRLGSIGHMGAYSFHETKNYTSGGEGGLLLVNDKEFSERAEIIREKGTNRSKFFKGMVDKYSWVDLGSSYLPSELQSAYLYAQTKSCEKINEKRLSIWNEYNTSFQSLQDESKLTLPVIPKSCQHNAHMFYIKLSDSAQRSDFIKYMKDNGINTAFHYLPLHSSNAGKQFGKFYGQDENTTKESERLVRLPLFYNMIDGDLLKVLSSVKDYFNK